MALAPITLPQFFGGLVENVFEVKLGVPDVPVIEYVSGLLIRFTRSDQFRRLRNLTGQPVVEIVDMLHEAENRIGLARRDAHRHIGDSTLFWVGVYPESLQQLKRAKKKDYFVDFCRQGKRAYHIASRIQADEEPSGDLLARLSAQFELLAYGLGEVRREWEHRTTPV